MILNTSEFLEYHPTFGAQLPLTFDGITVKNVSDDLRRSRIKLEHRFLKIYLIDGGDRMVVGIHVIAQFVQRLG